MAEGKKKDFIISIGRIVNSFGNSGEVKVSLLTDFPERFQSISSVIISKTGKDADFSAEILGVRYHKKFVILKFDISNSIEDARDLKGFFVCINKSELYPLSEDSFYMFDLIGLIVYTREGRYLGKVEDVYQLPAHDILVVLNGTEEILIPLVKEFISEINLEGGKVTVIPYEGLF